MSAAVTGVASLPKRVRVWVITAARSSSLSQAYWGITTRPRSFGSVGGRWPAMIHAARTSASPTTVTEPASGGFLPTPLPSRPWQLAQCVA